MSRPCVIDNFLHAVSMLGSAELPRRVWQLPPLEATLSEIVDAIATFHGDEVLEKVSYDENPELEAQYATFPSLHCLEALAAGFCSDGNLEALVQNALAPDDSA